MKVGIIGTGKVATSLATGLVQGGHSVMLGSRAPAGKKAPTAGISVGTQADAVKFGEAVILAVPFSAAKETIGSVGAGAWRGKTLIDATNAFPPPDGWVASTSGAEEIAKLAPGAKVVKAFNTVFAQNMTTGQVGGTKIAAFVAGDDPQARRTVQKLAGDIGFDPVDAGPLSSARYLEAMAMMNIRLGYELKMGAGIGFALARSG